MRYRDLPFKCKAYLVCIYALALPVTFFSLKAGGEYSTVWLLFTIASLFIATINIHLPQLPSVIISMGDVFTVLALIHFGEGPALLTYWTNVLATAIIRYIRHVGVESFR